MSGDMINIEDLSRQVAQLGINCRWLIGKIDTIFYALCPNKIGTWQGRAEMAAQAAVELAQRSANTGSPKLPSEKDVWNYVRDTIIFDAHCTRDRLSRAVTSAAYDFIARQLRAGA
jgi:hypothetical protein